MLFQGIGLELSTSTKQFCYLSSEPTTLLAEIIPKKTIEAFSGSIHLHLVSKQALCFHWPGLVLTLPFNLVKCCVGLENSEHSSP